MMMSFIYFLQKQQPVRVPGPAQLPKPDTTHVLLLLNGNSAEKIVELKKEYDFTDVRTSQKMVSDGETFFFKSVWTNRYLRLPSLDEVESHSYGR